MSPLPAWLQTPPPTLGLQIDTHRVTAVLVEAGGAVERGRGRLGRVALAVPDTAARVSLVPFAQGPASARDLEQLVRLQLRRTVPFPADEAELAWARGPLRGTGTTIVVAAM